MKQNTKFKWGSGAWQHSVCAVAGVGGPAWSPPHKKTDSETKGESCAKALKAVTREGATHGEVMMPLVTKPWRRLTPC